MSTETEGQSREPNTSGLRPWKKGQSGNPHGRRPKGLATVEKLRTVLAKDLPAILDGVVKQAKDGDLGAAKLILERVLPPLKAVEGAVFIDALGGSLSEQGQGILQAMAAGELSPGQAVQLLTALAAQARIVEVDELERRLSKLEQKVEAEHASNQPARSVLPPKMCSVPKGSRR